jgi:flagellar basal body-associated protein FliL
VVQFEPFVVSDWEGNGEHVSTVTFEVEVSDPAGRDALKSHTSEIRSAILTVLADAKLSDIGAPEDFAALKMKVQGRVQSLLPNHAVRRVLITEFLSL